MLAFAGRSAGWFESSPCCCEGVQVYLGVMTLAEKIVAVLQERSFEIRDGASKMEAIESTDFEQVALDIIEILSRDYGFEAQEEA